jgi:hypothetical protein
VLLALHQPWCGYSKEQRNDDEGQQQASAARPRTGADRS